MYTSKILALYQAGEGGAFWPAAYFDPKELLATEPLTLGIKQFQLIV